jgi:flagellar FliL protein
MSAAAHAPAPAAEAPAKRGPGIMTLVKALAFVSVIVLIEVAAATAFLPSAEETRQTGERLVSAAQGAETEAAAKDAAEAPSAEADPAAEHGAASSEHAEGANQPTVELSLGTYHVIAFNPSTGASMSIDFELFGVVLAADEPEFTERFGLHAKRLNEQVTIAIRGMESADFTDPGLGLIKRVVLEKVNRALGKPLVREAVFSEFAFIER